MRNHGGPNPHCRTCKRRVIWHLPATSAPASRTRVACSRLRKKLAIRCVDCLDVFCPKCAHKHFVPVVRQLDLLIEEALKKARCKGTIQEA
jgi:hypothetical protein